MRLIDADALLKKTHNYYPSIDHYCCSRKAVDTKDINEAPTIDAEPVVRCYKCKQSERISSPFGTVVHCHCWGKDVDYDGFCHEGY